MSLIHSALPHSWHCLSLPYYDYIGIMDLGRLTLSVAEYSDRNTMEQLL